MQIMTNGMADDWTQLSGSNSMSKVASGKETTCKYVELFIVSCAYAYRREVCIGSNFIALND